MPTTDASRAVRVLTAAFFVAYLLVGVAVYRDYGISWDEVPTREFGIMNVERMVPDLGTLDSLRAVKGPAFERFGPLFEILLVNAEKLAAPSDARSAFMLRHLITFLVFYAGVVCFFLLCRRRFTPGIALLTTVCLAANPLLFSHAFFNTKDISFLATFVAAMLTLDHVLSSPTWRTVLWHVLTTVALLGTRVIGLFAMMLTGVAAIARRPTRRTLVELAAYGVLVLLLLPVVWPVLRVDPVGIVKGAVLGSASNPYFKTDLFRGQMIPASDLPWDYVPTWILITTPIVVSALFIVGATWALVGLAKSPREYLRGERQRDVIVLCWFFAPVLGTVILRPIMYDAWRHLFFVFPALVYLAGIGMEAVVTTAIARVGDARRPLVNAAAAVTLLLCLAPAVAFMVANHPFEYLYFNRLAGRDMAEIKQRFELDYWGLSYRKALEHIVRSDSSAAIHVQVANYPGVVNSLMLEPRDRARIRYVAPEEAEYFVTNYRFHPQDYPLSDEVFSVRVGNASIVSVFRLPRRDSVSRSPVPR
ncbi:MAG: hypothetical protein ACRENU_16855 [Gemmatimonadaceae bacterium]